MPEEKSQSETDPNAGAYQAFQEERTALLEHRETMASRLGRPVGFEEALLDWAGRKKKAGEEKTRK